MLIELETPPTVDPDDHLLETARALQPPLGRALAAELEEATLGFDEAKHPRWPDGTPGGLGGKFMKVGQVFKTPDGKTWEVDHILAHRVIAHEASGSYAKAETREFDTTKTPGPANQLGGITRPKAKSVKGGQSGSDVTVVDPYTDPATHDPSIPIPANSSLSPEEWKAFGRLEQLHYTELQARYGKHSAGGASSLIKQAYNEFDSHTADMVSNSYSEQYGSSSGWSLSLTRVFQKIFNKGGNVEKAREERERARELQGQIRDAYAWDLYNRTHSPDVVMVHKDKHNHPSSWWKQQFLDGGNPIFSGLSQSHHFRSSFWSQQTGVAHAVSIRHVVMSTWVAGPMKGAKKSFQGEEEMAVPFQMKLDAKRTMSFHNKDIPQGARDWLEDQTDHPAGGEIFRMFQANVEHGAYLPIPPPKPKITMHGQGWLPPPQGAADALEEYQQNLPGGGSGSWSGTPQDLKKFDLPWANVDDKGVPIAKIASESGYNPGDFLMGKKGTLYWLGPNPGDTSGLGLMIHKIVPDGKGGLTFNGENFAFKDGVENYKLQSNFPPPTLAKEEFDPEGWTQDVGDPVPISKLAKGDKFKVDGTPYELVEAPGKAQASIRDLGSGITGQINSDYQTNKLVPKEGYVPKGQLQPTKGMTFAYNGKKHTITRVSKDGVVSAKPVTAGSTVVKVAPSDPALQSLFDPKAWATAKGDYSASSFNEGDLFTIGRGKTLRPHLVTGTDSKWIYWTNLDSGETGKSLKKKKLTPLVSKIGEASPEPVADLSPAPQTSPKGLNYDDLKPGDSIQLGELKVGDEVKTFPGGKGPTYHLMAAPDPADEESKWIAAPILKDGTLGPEAPLGSDTDQVSLYMKQAPTKLPEAPGAHLGYSSGQEVEVKKNYGNQTWKATVVGHTTTPGGADALEVQTTTKTGPKVYTVKLPNVITPPNETKVPGGGTTAEAPPPLTDSNIAHDTLPTLDEENFPAYKSSHGPGGKYKHDRLEAMPTGTVFQDKTGAQWLVVEGGSTPIVTDGQQNYLINGKLRGRALPGRSWDKPEPALPHATASDPDPAVVAAKAEQVQIQKIAKPTPQPSTVGEMEPGQELGSSGIEVVTHTAKGNTIVKDTLIGENLTVVPSGSSPEEAVGMATAQSATPEPAEEEDVVGSLGQDDEFEGANGHPFKVVTESSKGFIVQDLQSGQMATISEDTPLGEVREMPNPIPDTTDEFGKTVGVVEGNPHGPGTIEAQELKDNLISSGYDPAYLPTEALKGYGSAWGSGGKYKHPYVNELAPGDHFRDKTKTEMVYLGKEGALHMVYRPSDGTAFLVLGNERVRVLD